MATVSNELSNGFLAMHVIDVKPNDFGHKTILTHDINFWIEMLDGLDPFFLCIFLRILCVGLNCQ